MANILTKDGLTGNSGLNVANLPIAFHVSANYAAGRERCFVVIGAKRRDGPWWRRMTVRRAKKEHREIIPCSYCKRHATSVDHFWPYHSEANHCAYHRDWHKLADEAATL